MRLNVAKPSQFANMDQLVTSAKVFAGVLGGMVAGWDPMLKALIGFIILDYVTGCLKVFILSGGIMVAFRDKRWRSEIGTKGISKKVMLLLMVAACHFADMQIGTIWDAGGIKLGSMAAGLYAINEFGSIIENVIASEVPVPGLLKRALAKIREKFAE